MIAFRFLPALLAASAAAFPIEVRTFFTTSDGLPSNDVAALVISNGELFARTPAGVAKLRLPNRDRKGAVPSKGRWSPIDPTHIKFPQIPSLTATDSKGRIWSARPGAVEMRQSGRVTIYTPAQGLPYNDFTSVAAGTGNTVWFGTHKGAIRFDGKTWEYRQGLRWLPADDIRSVVVDANDNAWFATSAGVGVIER